MKSAGMTWGRQAAAFFRGEVSGWTVWETVWLVGACAAVIATSLSLGDTPMSFVAALTGILYSVLAGKGKRSCYAFGVVNTVCYALLSFEFRLYGEVMLYGGYYLPMMFIGFFVWGKQLDGSQTIVKTRLGDRARAGYLVAAVIWIAAYGWLLNCLDGRTPWLDSTTNVLSCIAMILTVKRCIEQWYLWLVVNLISIVMWWIAWYETGDASGVIMMYGVLLATAVFFLLNWRRSIQPSPKES